MVRTCRRDLEPPLCVFLAFYVFEIKLVGGLDTHRSLW